MGGVAGWWLAELIVVMFVTAVVFFVLATLTMAVLAAAVALILVCAVPYLHGFFRGLRNVWRERKAENSNPSP